MSGNEGQTAYWLKIRNWEKYQHYKNQNVPWIKLYEGLFDDQYFRLYSDSIMILYIGSLILAKRYDGYLPCDLEWIQSSLSLDEKPCYDNLIKHEFVIPCDESRQPLEGIYTNSRLNLDLKSPHISSIREVKELTINKYIKKNTQKNTQKGSPPKPKGNSKSALAARKTYGDLFEKFWREYPRGRRGSKLTTAESWENGNLDSEARHIIEGLRAWKESDQWTAKKPAIVLATTFLNQRRWEDPPPKAKHLEQSANVVTSEDTLRF